MTIITSLNHFRFEGLKLNINTGNGQFGCFVDILTRIAEQLLRSCDRHSKVLVFIFQLHLKTYSPQNKKVSQLFQSLKPHLQSRLGLNQIGYIWAREHDQTTSQHYHCAIFLDGNKLKHPSIVLKALEHYWQKNGSCYTTDQHHYLVRRGDLDTLNKAFYHLSYIAKTNTKERRPRHTNRFGASRIKPLNPTLNRKSRKDIWTKRQS